MNLELRKLGSNGVEYLLEYLADGKTLSQELLKAHNISEGAVATFLPFGTPDEMANDLKHGGRLDTVEDTALVFSSTNGATMQMVPKPNADLQFSELLQSYLCGDERAIVVFEDAVSSPTDKWLVSAGTRLFTVGNDVYHLLMSKDREELERIQNTINRARSWRFVAAFSSAPCQNSSLEFPSALDAEALKAIAKSAVGIVVGAYDGESFLQWLPKQN